MYLLWENREAYIPSSLSLGNVIEHHCVRVIVLPKLAADSVENRKEVGGTTDFLRKWRKLTFPTHIFHVVALHTIMEPSTF